MGNLDKNTKNIMKIRSIETSIKTMIKELGEIENGVDCDCDIFVTSSNLKGYLEDALHNACIKLLKTEREEMADKKELEEERSYHRQVRAEYYASVM